MEHIAVDDDPSDEAARLRRPALRRSVFDLYLKQCPFTFLSKEAQRSGELFLDACFAFRTKFISRRSDGDVNGIFGLR